MKNDCIDLKTLIPRDDRPNEHVQTRAWRTGMGAFLAFLCALAVSASAQVDRLIVGIDVNCPAGLSE